MNSHKSVTPEELAKVLAEALAESLSPAELSTEQTSSMRRRVLQAATDVAPIGTRTVRASQVEWTPIAPFIEAKALRIDVQTGNQTVLLRMQPGGVIPGHVHTQEEEFVVLEGECHIGAHKLSAGDIHLAASGSWHDAITTQTGVMVLLRGEYPPPVQRQHAAAPAGR